MASLAALIASEPSHAAIFHNSVVTRYVGLAGFTIMIFDHIITFAEEFEFIWKGKKGPIIYLFFLNRYLIPVSFIVNIFAYFSKVWDYNVRAPCNNFVVYEGIMTMVGITIACSIMFLRIRALYYRQLYVQGLVLAVLATFVGMNSWLLTHRKPIFLKAPTVISCTMVFDPSIGAIAASSAWLPLLYDTLIVSLTIFRTVKSVWQRTAGDIVTELLREGLLYYSLIFSVTLTLTIMIVTADASVKNITAQLELCLTATMMSRITLDLKRFAHGGTLGYHGSGHDLSSATRNAKGQRISWRAVTHPSRVRRGRVQHIGPEEFGFTVEPHDQRRGEDTSFFARVTQDAGDTSFFAMVTQDSGVAAGAHEDAGKSGVFHNEEYIEMKVQQGAADQV